MDPIPILVLAWVLNFDQVSYPKFDSYGESCLYPSVQQIWEALLSGIEVGVGVGIRSYALVVIVLGNDALEELIHTLHLGLSRGRTI